jgi:hypothetical protein
MSGLDARRAQLHLLPDELDKVPRTGAVGSAQAGKLLLPGHLSRVLNRDFLSRAGQEYWRFITRISLGLIRMTHAGDHHSVVLLARPLVLLRFRPPDYELREDGGSVTWPIERGLLVARDGRNRGFLRLSVERVDEPAAGDRVPVRVRMEVRNFYPWLRGSGRFARFGVWLYSQTQQRIHRSLTRGFLRSLARTMPGSGVSPPQPGSTEPG